jgi:ligand-binding sensor domain-containing protein/signal transduction histidine kinase
MIGKKKTIQFFLAGAILAWNFTCQAQQYSLRKYSNVDGLPLSQITALKQDSLGYLWVGSLGGGLARFDGREFKIYSTFDGLLANTISDLIIDKNQQMWVCHPRGISKFINGRFKSIDLPKRQENDVITSFFTLKDTLQYVTTKGEVGYLKNDSLLFLKALPDSSTAILVKNSLRYFATKNKGDNKSYMYSGNDAFKHEVKPSNLEIEEGRSSVNPTPAQQNSHLLFYDNETKASWKQSKNMLLVEYTQRNQAIDTLIENVTVNQIYRDTNGNIWIATDGNGLYRCTKPDFSRCLSGKYYNVMTILKDKKGATWIGTLNGGINQFYKNKSYSYNTTNKLEPDRILNIKQNQKGEIWAATNHGLAQYDSLQNYFKVFSKEDGFPDEIWCMDFDSEGAIWAGTPNGLFAFKNEKIVLRYPATTSTQNFPVYAIYNSSKTGTKYIGTNDGLQSIRNGKMKPIEIKEIKNAVIQSISGYKEKFILIGTNGAGASLYNPENGTYFMLTMKNCLPSNIVYFIFADPEGFIWVGSEKGISRILLDAQNNIIANQHFGSDNGLTGIETNQNAYFFGKEKYFGLIDGLYKFNDDIKHSIAHHPIHLTDVQIYYGTSQSRLYAKSSKGNFQIPDEPIFPSDKNHITLFFNRIDRLLATEIRFQYFLENFDNTWSPPTTQRQVTYSNLPPGEYVFKVKTLNQDKSDNQFLTYPFTIETPFYKTVWFIATFILFLIVVSIVFAYWQIRSRSKRFIIAAQIRHKDNENLRKELARNFHDEMGNQLTRIINYVSLLKLNNSNKNNTNNNVLYDKVEASAKSLYTGTRDFIWSIDPNNDDLVKVFIHIKDFAEGMLYEKDIQLITDNRVKGNIPLPYGASREIILIFKEAFTNIFKHSQAKNVRFTLEKIGEALYISLLDDGIEFDYSQKQDSGGIVNMKSRARKITSTLQIQKNVSGKGTLVELVIKPTSKPKQL